LNSPQTRYPHPLIDRYASAEMADVFSPRHQALIWRDLWIALAECEQDLGVEIPDAALEEMRSGRDQVDLARIAEFEADLRHDVMAHIHHFGELAPTARPFIHLGATSCFVSDNAGLIQIGEALQIVRTRLLEAAAELSVFCRTWASTPTLGYTHWQPAQPTTVGKRASMWLQDLVLDIRTVDDLLADLLFRGARGTTGTEASFKELFDGNGDKVDELNKRLAEKFGFAGTWRQSRRTQQATGGEVWLCGHVADYRSDLPTQVRSSCPVCSGRNRCERGPVRPGHSFAAEFRRD